VTHKVYTFNPRLEKNGSPCSEPSWYSRKSLLRYLGFPGFTQKERQAGDQIIKYDNPKEYNQLKQPNKLSKPEEPKEPYCAKAELSLAINEALHHEKNERTPFKILKWVEEHRTNFRAGRCLGIPMKRAFF